MKLALVTIFDRWPWMAQLLCRPKLSQNYRTVPLILKTVLMGASCSVRVLYSYSNRTWAHDKILLYSLPASFCTKRQESLPVRVPYGTVEQCIEPRQQYGTHARTVLVPRRPLPDGTVLVLVERGLRATVLSYEYSYRTTPLVLYSTVLCHESQNPRLAPGM